MKLTSSQAHKLVYGGDSWLRPILDRLMIILRLCDFAFFGLRIVNDFKVRNRIWAPETRLFFRNER